MPSWHWYKWFAETWFASETRHSMTLEMRGLYRDALDLQSIEGSIPRDPEVLRRMLAADREEFARSWPVVSEKFVPFLTDRLVNLRQKDELDARETTRTKRSEAGVSGGKQSGKVRRSKREANASVLLKQKRSKNEAEERRGEESRPTLKTKAPATPKQSPPTSDSTDLASIWNSECGSLPKVQRVGAARKAKIKARLREEDFPVRFRDAVRKACTIAFYTGDNERGWVMGFDYLIANDDNVTKVLESQNGKDRRTDRPEIAPWIEEWTEETAKAFAEDTLSRWAVMGKHEKAERMRDLTACAEERGAKGKIIREVLTKVQGR